MVGYSPEELQASAPLEQVHPDDRERVRKAAEDSRLSGSGKDSWSIALRHKNGNWLVLESTSRVILLNSKGEPEKLIIVNRDITERKRAEDALRRSEADFRSVVEDAPYGIYRASITGRLLQANPALQTMLGYQCQQDLLKCDLATDIFKQNDEYRRLTELLTSNGEIKDIETEWKRQRRHADHRSVFGTLYQRCKWRPGVL